MGSGCRSNTGHSVTHSRSSRFQRPDGADRNTCVQVGAYWLDTMERWQMMGPTGTASDSVLLAEEVVGH